jgi:DNA-binding transcriptional regulator YiaG
MTTTWTTKPVATFWTPRTVRELRKRLRLTQMRFAALLGVTDQTVSHWENHSQYPSDEHAYLLGRAAA